MKRNSPRGFHYRDAHFHITTTAWDEVTESIIEERNNLEAFIALHREFETSLVPLRMSTSPHFPESVKRMLIASDTTGLGPMAAVAGTMAQLAGEISRSRGCLDTIVENGGDIFLDCREEVILGLYAGKNSPFNRLALRVDSSLMPVAACTSSSRMGHSLSFGDCDIFTVFSKDAALADAAATLGCNSVRSPGDLESVLNKIVAIDGILGAIAIRDGNFGAAGTIPEIIRSGDPGLEGKVSADPRSGFSPRNQ